MVLTSISSKNSNSSQAKPSIPSTVSNNPFIKLPSPKPVQTSSGGGGKSNLPPAVQNALTSAVETTKESQTITPPTVSIPQVASVQSTPKPSIPSTVSNNPFISLPGSNRNSNLPPAVQNAFNSQRQTASQTPEEIQKNNLQLQQGLYKQLDYSYQIPQQRTVNTLVNPVGTGFNAVLQAEKAYRNKETNPQDYNSLQRFGLGAYGGVRALTAEPLIGLGKFAYYAPQALENKGKYANGLSLLKERDVQAGLVGAVALPASEIGTIGPYIGKGLTALGVGGEGYKVIKKPSAENIGEALTFGSLLATPYLGDTFKSVNVGGKNVATGIFNPVTGEPIATRVATGKNVLGDLTYSYKLGKPETVAYPDVTTAYTPSGKAETKLYLKAFGTGDIKNIPGVDVPANYEVVSNVRNRKANIYDADYLNTFFKDAGLEKSSTDLQGYFKGQKNYEIYGSTPTKAQLSDYRTPKDLDVVFNTAKGTEKAKEIASIINVNQGPGTAVANEEGQILVNGIKKFDIHGTDNPPDSQITQDAFGFKKIQSKNINGFPTSQLGQEATNKLASVGSLQPEGFAGPDLVRRGKDIADSYVINKELIQLGGKGSITSAVENTKYRESALNYFGEDLLTKDYPKLLAFNSEGASASPNKNIPTISFGFGKSSSVNTSPSLGTSLTSLSSSSFVEPSLSLSSSNKKNSSPSPSNSLSKSLSKSFSLSPSPSPSKSPSPSLFSSLSLSPSPPSIPSPSFSFSFGGSPSPSPSRTPSKSPSPSLTPSYSWLDFPSPSQNGGGGESGKSANYRGKRKTGFIPSATALIFGIKGKYKGSKTAESTGLNFRPIDTKLFKINRGGLRLRR